MNARQIKDAMRLYLVECVQTDGIKNLKQFVSELESESNEIEADNPQYY